LRPDRALAVAAFLLAATALLLPWWQVTLDDGTFVDRYTFRAFQPVEPWTTAWAPWLTGLLAAAAIALLFLRLAANSHEHEPASWRRDLSLATGLLAAAVASCLLWPNIVPSFWGGRTYTVATGPPTTETAMPGLGWWLALVATLLAALASWKSRQNPAGQGAHDATTK
jgi:cytochrome bd-type quinol oxidase subunit 2